MHKNIKEFNLSLDKIHEVHPSHKLYWDHGGKESPAKFDGYYQYGSWLMGLEGDYYTLYCLAYSEFWHSCYPCTRITQEESGKINTEIISLIDKHFPIRWQYSQSNLGLFVLSSLLYMGRSATAKEYNYRAEQRSLQERVFN